MAELASERVRLHDISRKRSSDGATLVELIPWQIVTYLSPTPVSGVEPLDWTRGNEVGLRSEKEVTGIQAMPGDLLFTTGGTGGASDFPAT